MIDQMANRLVAMIVLVFACRSGEHSTPERSSKPRDAGGLRKVALPPPDDDTVAFERSTFRGSDRNCKLDTLVRVYPGTEFLPNRVQLSVDAFAIDRRAVSCFDFDRCIESGHCAGSARLANFPTVSRGSYCTSGVAIVNHDAAEAYCRWRGMSLPTVYQWQRAIRGADGMEFPAGHHRDNTILGPDLTSPDGVIYSTERKDSWEWLRDRDCLWFTEGGKDVHLEFVAMELGPRLDSWSGANDARFRCVRTAEIGAGPRDGGTAP